MDEQELARLVVRLLGESESFTKTFQDAKKEADDAKEKIEEAGGVIDKTTGKLAKLGAVAATAFGAFKGFEFLQESERMYKETEIAERQLTAILKIQDREVNKLKQSYKELANELMNKVGVDDDEIIALAKKAELMGVTGEEAKRAIKNAHALAAAHGGVAESYIRQTIALENGRLGRLAMLLGMGDMEEGADKVAEAQNKLSKMWQFAVEEGKSYEGMLKRQESELGNLRESYGKVVKDAIQPFRDILLEVKGQLIAWLDSMGDGTKKIIVAAIAAAAALGGLAAALAAIVALKGAILGVLGAVAAMLTMLATNPIVAWTVVITAAVIAVKELAKELTGLNYEMNKLAQQQKLRAQLDAELAELAEKRAQAVLKEFSSLPLKEKELAIRERMLDIERELVAARGRLARDEKIVDDERGIFRRLRENIIGEDPTLAMYRMQVNETKGSIERLEKQYKAFKAAHSETMKEINAAKGGPLLGFTLELVAVVSKLAGLQAKSDELAKGMWMEAETFGMSSREIAIYKLQLEGATEEMLETARANQRIIEAFEEDAKLTERGIQLKKEFETPLEKYNARMEELNDLLKANKIEQDTFNRAAEDAQKTLDASSASVSNMNMELQKLDATLSGSTAAKERVASFKAIMEEQNAAERMKRNAAGPEIRNTQETKKQDEANNWLRMIFMELQKQAENRGLDIDPTDFES